MEEKVKFVVRVQCATYNHVNYITDAMNGFCMQKTTFPFVCSIVDDDSTDGEQEVIKAYLKEYFDMEDNSIVKCDESDDCLRIFAQHKINKNCFFAVVFLKYNHYSIMKPKDPYIQEWLDTQYIALCEGDDYWTDPLKLQKQVDLLEKDSSLMAVATNSTVVDKSGKVLKPKQDKVVPDNIEGRYDLRSFMYKVHNYPTATVCYRRTHVEEIAKMTEHMSNPYLGDWTKWIALHIFGDFFYLDQVTSAYRINPTSLTHTYDRVGRSKANWTICKSVQDILPDEYDDIRKSLDKNAWMWIDLGFAYKHEKKYIKMLWSFFIAFIKDPKGLLRDFHGRKQYKNKLCQQQ